MKETKYNPKVKLGEQIPNDKFDKHMQKARKSTMESRQKVFIAQNEKSADRKGRYSNIKSSVY